LLSIKFSDFNLKYFIEFSTEASKLSPVKILKSNINRDGIHYNNILETKESKFTENEINYKAYSNKKPAIKQIFSFIENHSNQNLNRNTIKLNLYSDTKNNHQNINNSNNLDSNINNIVNPFNTPIKKTSFDPQSNIFN
jgi:hypothetical protein